jgi:EpsI family protein
LGIKTDKKLFYIVLLLLITCFFIYKDADTTVSNHIRSKLSEFLREIDGYKIGTDIPLEKGVSNMLKLDDYVFTNYNKDNQNVTLYIGHYYTLAKLTAAHSPLVCYPSQGWIIDEPITHQVTISNDTLHYGELVARLGDKQELIMYWYQAYHKSMSEISKLKLATAINKLRDNNEQHGFVRVSIPFSGTDQEQARATGLTFIKAFWPHYLSYIENNNPKQ